MSAIHDLMPGRVSLIVPCYNVEFYAEEFFASVNRQTYKDLEIIIVNDGANAATTSMLRAAAHQLKAEGYLVKLIEQVNMGLGGAVNSGLKHFTGEFLMWPDPDDWLLPNSIERRVELMRQYPEVGLLRTNARLYVEARQEYDGCFMPDDGVVRKSVDLFEHLLFMRYFFGPVCHMVRSEMFLQVHPDRSIYFSPVSSQNFQLLVPFVEAFPVLEVHEPLAVYRVREDSRSRAPNKTRVKLMERFDQLLDLTEHTLPKLKTYTPERHRRLLNFHWRNRMLPTAFRGAMVERCVRLVSDSSLAPWRKALARVLITLRKSPLFERVDVRTGKVGSRLLARVFDRLVQLPRHQLKWGAAPLWS